MIALFVLPHGTESVSGKKKKILLLSHKMAIAAKEKGALRRDCSESNKSSSLKVAYTNSEEKKKKSVFQVYCKHSHTKPSVVIIPNPGPQLPVSSGSSDILLSKQLSFNLPVPFNQ